MDLRRYNNNDGEAINYFYKDCFLSFDAAIHYQNHTVISQKKKKHFGNTSITEMFIQVLHNHSKFCLHCRNRMQKSCLMKDSPDHITVQSQ